MVLSPAVAGAVHAFAHAYLAVSGTGCRRVPDGVTILPWMKQIHVARHPTEAHLVKGILEAGGVRAEVKGDQLYGAFGELPVLPTVWIFDETLAERANELVVEFLRGSAAQRYGHERWTCAQCGEILEGQFTACWQCGALRT